MAMWLFSEMRNSGCRPDTSVYNALITAHLHSKDKAKSLTKALAYFEKMKSIERCQPNVVTYNIILRAFAQARNVNQVNALFKDLEESIVSPDIYTYNGVLDAYGKNGMIREMESVLSRMKIDQCKPDIITFNLLIDSYGKKQDFEKMEQVFKSLLRSKEKPTLPTFNSMIVNYGKARLKDKAESVFKKMADMRYTPSFITFEGLIMMYGICDCVSKARDIFDDMVESGKEVKVSTLNAVLNVYCMNGLHMEAHILLENARSIGVPPNSSTYKLLYRAFTKAKMKELVQKLLKHMDKDGIIPNKRFFVDALGASKSSGASSDSTIPLKDSNSPQNVAKTLEEWLVVCFMVSSYLFQFRRICKVCITKEQLASLAPGSSTAEMILPACSAVCIYHPLISLLIIFSILHGFMLCFLKSNILPLSLLLSWNSVCPKISWMQYLLRQLFLWSFSVRISI